MTPARAIDIIRECVAAERVIVKDHCTERLAERGLFWGDLLCLLASPTRVRGDGDDEFGRERWFVKGKVAGEYLAEVLCAVDVEDPSAVFITVYWED